MILYHEGPSDVKESRVMDLKLCYNTFKFKEGESLTQTFTIYKSLMNELVNDGIKLSKLEIDIGFINGLPKKWLAFCQSLRNITCERIRACFSICASSPKSSLGKNKGLIAETYEWDEEEVSSNENEAIEVKAIIALANEERVSVRKANASNATDYDSADESSVCSTVTPQNGAWTETRKLDRVEPVSGSKTIKSILKSKSTFKAETLKGIIINEPSSASARGNKSSSASKTNSALAGKLKKVKIEDDPPLAIVKKELNDLKLQINKNKSSYSRNKRLILYEEESKLETLNMSQRTMKHVVAMLISHLIIMTLSGSKKEKLFKLRKLSLSKQDIINKMKKKKKEKVIPYTIFLSLLMMQKMKDGYGDGDVTIHPTQIFSVNNWALKPNQPEGHPFTAHMMAICNTEKPVAFKAPKPSSNAERVPQGTKPEAKPGHKKHSPSSKQPPVSSSEVIKYSTAEVDPVLSAPMTLYLNNKNKAKTEAALLKAQPSFPNMGQLNELLVNSLQTKFSKILSAYDFSSSLPTELKDLPSKFNELTGEVKGLKKQVYELEIELPGEWKEIPTKLEDFTKTVTSITSQVAKLKTLQWELPHGRHIHLNEEEINHQKKLEEDAKAEAAKQEGEYDRYCDKLLNRRAEPRITNCDVLTKKGLVTLKVHIEDGTSEVIPNFKASDLHLGEWREVVKACPNQTRKGWKIIYDQIQSRMDYLHITKAELGINLDIPLSKHDPLDKLNDLANKKRKHADDIHDYLKANKRLKSSIQYEDHLLGTLLNEPIIVDDHCLRFNGGVVVVKEGGVEQASNGGGAVEQRCGVVVVINW
nr:retrovirus-related Pol polyprotein from transposon TNT 1-94 [Tanacetum cinerariifolium]